MSDLWETVAMIKRSTLGLITTCLLVLVAGCYRGDAAPSGPGPIIKITALANGEILVDGQVCSLADLRTVMTKAVQTKSPVYYYREAADQEPHPNAIEAIRIVAESNLPISLSTRPDFSDYVDNEGRSHPRDQAPGGSARLAENRGFRTPAETPICQPTCPTARSTRSNS